MKPVKWCATPTNIENGTQKNDSLRGTSGLDEILGGRGNDKLLGGAGSDWLYGGAGNDSLFGGKGDDLLSGGLGRDILTGGKGADTFAFNTAPDRKNVDIIKDFSSAEGDKIMLMRDAFTLRGDVAPDQFTLNPNAFHIGKEAHDADDRIIYDQATGSLYIDSDGNGSAAAVKFAQLKPGAVLQHSDFDIF